MEIPWAQMELLWFYRELQIGSWTNVHFEAKSRSHLFKTDFSSNVMPTNDIYYKYLAGINCYLIN